MKRNEYQKGDIVEYEYGITRIVTSAFSDYQVEGIKKRHIWANNITPVQLNDKVLLSIKECIHDGSDYVIKIDDTTELRLTYGGIDYYPCLNKTIVLKRIRYLHQLQLLYHVLSGNELTIKIEEL